MLRRRFFSFLFIAAAAECVGAEKSLVPKHFKAYIGGFLGPRYWVELKGETLSYRESDQGKPTSVKDIRPSAAQWAAFRKALDEINVWRWLSDYPNEGAADGTQWSLEIAYAENAKVNSKGSNRYPDLDGKARPQSTKTFERYLNAVQKLIGDAAFR